MRDQPFWAEHASFMNGLAAKGFVILGGPVGDGNDALHIVACDSPARARATLAEDPWEPAGLMEIVTIEPWDLLLGDPGRLGRPRQASMEVRPALPEDARRIAEIHVQTWQVAYDGIVPAEYLASLSVERYESMWRDNIAKGAPELLVAHEDEAILGWVAYGHSRDEGAKQDVAEIWAIYVDASRWATGVGRSLWAAAKPRLLKQGFSSVGLWAFPENERAGRFYRSLGFEIEAGSAKQFVLGGASLNEIRYVRRLDA